MPVLPRDRWLSCWVRGPIIEVGWMDMAWSIVGVRTVPCWTDLTNRVKEWHHVQKAVWRHACVTTYSWLHEVWLMGHPGRAVYLHSAAKRKKSVHVTVHSTLVWTAGHFLGREWDNTLDNEVLNKAKVIQALNQAEANYGTGGHMWPVKSF